MKKIQEEEGSFRSAEEDAFQTVVHRIERDRNESGDEAVAGFIPVPFDPNRNRPTSFTKSGKPLRKIRQDGLPVLAVKFPGPWSLLASRPAAEKWWR